MKVYLNIENVVNGIWKAPSRDFASRIRPCDDMDGFTIIGDTTEGLLLDMDDPELVSEESPSNPSATSAFSSALNEQQLEQQPQRQQQQQQQQEQLWSQWQCHASYYEAWFWGGANTSLTSYQ